RMSSTITTSGPLPRPWGGRPASFARRRSPPRAGACSGTTAVDRDDGVRDAGAHAGDPGIAGVSGFARRLFPAASDGGQPVAVPCLGPAAAPGRRRRGRAADAPAGGRGAARPPQGRTLERPGAWACLLFLPASGALRRRHKGGDRSVVFRDR